MRAPSATCVNSWEGNNALPHAPDDIPASATPMIISQSETHVVLAVEIAKATLMGYRRLLEQLIEAAGERESLR
jgi:hypothetical protein